MKRFKIKRTKRISYTELIKDYHDILLYGKAKLESRSAAAIWSYFMWYTCIKLGSFKGTIYVNLFEKVRVAKKES